MRLRTQPEFYEWLQGFDKVLWIYYDDHCKNVSANFYAVNYNDLFLLYGEKKSLGSLEQVKNYIIENVDEIKFMKLLWARVILQSGLRQIIQS